jgi:hypothetical protein
VTRLLSALGLAVAVLAVAGCTAAPAPESNETPEQSQTRLLALLDDVQEQIGGEWTNEDSPSPRGCTLAGGDDGVTFTGTRTLEAPAPTDEQVDGLVSFLTDEGFEAGRSGMGAITDVLAVDPDDETSFVEVRITDQSSQLKGQAACAAGDINDELQRVKDAQ